MTDQDLMRQNQLAWDLRTPVHLGSKHYDLAAFKAGRSTLRPFEQEELGDVRGKSLLHLMCHIGVDTLSWARLGAKATGVDFSAESVAAARALAKELALGARFLESNLYDVPQKLDEQFDLVVTTYGVLCWLPDLAAWAEVIAQMLKPGGTFTVVDFHPTLSLFDDVDGKLTLARSAFRSGAAARKVERTYTDDLEVPEHHQHTWFHPVGEIITALATAGLHIQRVRELPLDLRQRTPSMTQNEAGFWQLPGNPIPLLLAITATRPT
jgi:2-polyprenyl-3-methyl-5-hydroxy-6-metoxy-1,4-benzoquinol methylase